MSAIEEIQSMINLLQISSNALQSVMELQVMASDFFIDEYEYYEITLAQDNINNLIVKLESELKVERGE